MQDLLDPDVLAQLAALAGAGRGDFVQRICDLYAEHAATACQALRDQVLAGDPEACARSAHALRSMSLNAGARQVAALAAEIEQAVRSEGTAPSEIVLASLSELLVRTLGALAEFAAQQHGSALVSAPAQAHDETPMSTARPGEDLERDLRRALGRDEVSVAYQPVLDRSGSLIVAVEALARWKRNGREDVSPGVFIALAERCGVIGELGEFVLRRACIDASAWPDLDVGVNVSPVQFLKPDLADRIERILDDTAMKPRRLKLEITESTLLAAEDAVLHMIDQLRRRGVAFSLDDFGTGYSSLTCLRRFPFQSIKIDRSFVTNLHTTFDATIVHAVVSIARGLGLKVVAEGVETAEQHKFLMAAGVHMMQGFLFARPMTKDALLVRLAEQERTLRSAG